MKIVVIGGSRFIGSASAVCRIATGSPVNGIVKVGGPEQFRVDELIREGLACCWPRNANETGEKTR